MSTTRSALPETHTTLPQKKGDLIQLSVFDVVSLLRCYHSLCDSCCRCRATRDQQCLFRSPFDEMPPVSLTDIPRFTRQRCPHHQCLPPSTQNLPRPLPFRSKEKGVAVAIGVSQRIHGPNDLYFAHDEPRPLHPHNVLPSSMPSSDPSIPSLGLKSPSSVHRCRG